MADVAVVEADHPVAARPELGAEGLVPVDHLGGEAHDQQHRLARRVAELLVGDLDPVHGSEPLAGEALGRGGAHRGQISRHRPPAHAPRSRSAERAALNPHIPCTPAPGGVAAEQM